MADAQVKSAIANWAPRCLQNGVDYNDFVATTRRCERWEDWLTEWSRTADSAVDLARQAEADGHDMTAGKQWLRASVTRHFGKFVWVLDRDLHWKTTRQTAEEMTTAHRFLGTGMERIEVPLDGSTVVANLRRPAGADRPGLVVLIPGLDSTKEEFFYLEEAFLQRGMATLSIDGPGQGEVGVELPIRPDYEVCVPPMLDALQDRDDLDFERIGVFGVSLGGYYAPRVAAHEKRTRAVIGLSGPYNFGEIWPDLPPMTKATFTTKSHLDDEGAAEEHGQTLDLTGICEEIEVPALYMTGKLDRLVPWEQTERMAKLSPKGEFILYDEGNHGCSNLSFLARGLLADWMRDRLAEVGATT